MISGRRSLGRFMAGRSFWHGLDPRTKLALVVLSAVALARPDVPSQLCVVSAVLLLAGLAGGLSAGSLASPLRSLGWLLAATALANLLLIPGEPLFSGMPGSREGLVKAIEATARLTGMLLAAQIMVLSTPALRLARGMEALVAPVPPLSKAVSGFPMVFSLTLRFVPLLLEEWERLRESAAVRGFTRGGIGVARRVVREAELLVPLFVVCLRRAEEMALSMHLRGYRKGARRSALHPLFLAPRDYLVIAAAAMGCVLSWTL